MSNYPEGLRYSKEHEWIKIDGNTVTMGVTEYAAEQLGDVVHVELPVVGAQFAKDASVGVVESVKSVSDVFSPVALTVTEVNSELLGTPGNVGEDPYGKGWIIKGTLANPTDVEGLMNAAGYKAFLSEEA